MESLTPAQRQALVEKLRLENEAFLTKAQEALTELFEAAKQRNELHFALSLTPEMRGCQGPGFNSAEECFVAIEDYVSYLNSTPDTSRLKVRIALAF